jgi:hypothetical protein
VPREERDAIKVESVQSGDVLGETKQFLARSNADVPRPTSTSVRAAKRTPDSTATCESRIAASTLSSATVRRIVRAIAAKRRSLRQPMVGYSIRKALRLTLLRLLRPLLR